MKSCISIIASLFLVSTPLISPPVAAETIMIAQEINPYIKDNIAREVTVKITSAENGGSGVIIAQSDNSYLILTNNHVLQNGDNFTIFTHDGVTHQATPVTQAIQSDDDLALLEFNSDNSYQTAKINSAATPKVDQAILAVGYSTETGELEGEAGTIKQTPDKIFKGGYGIGYSNDIVQGMSGGAILNVNGELIGINGKSAFPIVNTGYVYQDGTQPNSEEIEQLRQLSWGVSINRLLVQVNPEIITAYGLPLPETVGEVGKSELTGWLADLETKAKQITVRIDSSSGANGSGVIIAQEDNTYTVLTADHVLCEPDPESNCLDYTYEIVTVDGQKYPLDISTIRRQEGVDLAVVEFTSEETYQVAQLADYPVADDDAIFVAGYPKLDRDSVPPWRFSLGYGLEREQGLLNVNSNGTSSTESSSLSNQASLSGGYEMVYSSVTYGGMSGGAVLDRNGRVIGIHGLAEGETAFDNQSGYSTKIQLGYSLGIPVNTFVGLVDKLNITPTSPVQNNLPAGLNPDEKKALETAILETEIAQGNTTAQMWLERGNQLWRLKRYDEAIAAFEKAIALNPEFVHLAHHGKGLALYRQRKYSAALASFELATTLNPNYSAAFSWKSLSLQELNRWNQALVAIQGAIALQEHNPTYHNSKGNILSGLKQYPAAITAYDRAIKISPRSSFYRSRALTYLESEQPKLALADYNRAVELDPKSSIVYLARSGFYDEQGQPELALADLNQSIKLNPNYGDGYNDRGLLYQNRQQDDLALADFNQAIAIEPNKIYAYNNRGWLYYRQGQLELALTDFNRAVEIDPNQADVYNNRGLVYKQQDRLDLALADYNQAIKLDSSSSDAYSNRGSLYDARQQLDLALADFNQAIKLNPENAGAYTNRGLLYSKRKKFALALADFNRAIEIDPKLAQPYLNRGVTYYDLGKLDLALVDFNRAIQLNSNSATTAAAYFNRGNFYRGQGEYDLALADYNQAIKVDPQNAVFYSVRGDLLKIKEKPKLALADYNQAIKVDPNYARGYGGRGNIYANAGKPDLAQAALNKAIALDHQYGDAYVNLGFLHAENGDLKTAIDNLEKARQIFIEENNSEQEKIISQALELIRQENLKRENQSDQ